MDNSTVKNNAELSAINSNGDVTITKRTFFSKVSEGCSEFGNNLKEGFKKVGEGFKKFFQDPKTGLKNFWKFLKTQNGWLFVLPVVILMGIFTFYPIITAFINAFKVGYKLVPGAVFPWGVGNFAKVVQGAGSTAKFVICLQNTLLVALISVPLSTLLALLISVGLKSIKSLQKFYQTVFFLPYITNALAMGAVFATFFKIIGSVNNPESVGLVNSFLGLFGINPVNWINIGSSRAANLTVVVIYEIWAGLPFKILVLFGALQSVNKQYYDAAKIDGASKSKTLWKVTVPLISPMLSYLLITGLMGGLKVYSSIVGIFGESMGPNSRYEMGTMVGYIYSCIENNYIGYASAASLILFAIIMFITAINLYISKKKVHY